MDILDKDVIEPLTTLKVRLDRVYVRESLTMGDLEGIKS